MSNREGSMGIFSFIGRAICFLIGLGLVVLGIMSAPFGIVVILISLIFFYLAFRRRKKAYPFQQQQQQQQVVVIPPTPQQPIIIQQPPVVIQQPSQTSPRTIVKEVVMIPCKYCGALTPQTSTYCSNCGAPRR